MIDSKKRPLLIGIALGLMAAVIGFYSVGQALVLAFVNASPDISWDEEWRTISREWLWIVYATPILVLPFTLFAMPAVLAIYCFRWMNPLSHIALGATTGMIFWGDFLLPPVTLPLWFQGGLMGAGGGAAFWVILRIYSSFEALIARRLQRN